MPGCQRTQVHALQRVSARVRGWPRSLGVLRGVCRRPPAGCDSIRPASSTIRADTTQAIAAAARLRATPHGRRGQPRARPVLPRAVPEDRRPRRPRGGARGASGVRRRHAWPPSDRIDYLVGLGESLYLDDVVRAGGRVVRERARSRPRPRAAPRSTACFDWWATSLDRQAQSGAAGDRERALRRLVAQIGRLSSSLARIPGSSAAAYWLAASCVGAWGFDP